MRRSKSTNTLVIIKDQNKTLTQSKTNGVGLHIFEVIKPKNYIYRGVGVLCDKPYPAKQEDDDGKM